MAELNLWRPGGGLTLPFLRLATVSGSSRFRLLRATCDALVLSGGARDHVPTAKAAASYQDVARVVCRPIAHRAYDRPMAVQADGEVLGTSCAEIEMAALDVLMLAAS